MNALITGGAKRIGACITQTLHRHGYDVIIHCHRSSAEAKALAGELNNRRPDSATYLVDDLNESMTAGQVDLLVNNASVFFPTPIQETSTKEALELFQVNAIAPFILAQQWTPKCIVNIVDIYAEHPFKDHVLYCASKAALASMTRGLALDLAPRCRVNGIAPGAVLWPNKPNPYEDQKKLIEETPLKRAGTPQDIADAVLFLANAPFITGQILTIDGGRSL